MLEPELLDRYLAGECTEQEAATVRRHLMARPNVAGALSAYLQQLDGEGDRPAVPDASLSWDTMRRRALEPSSMLATPMRSAPPASTAPPSRHLMAMLQPHRMSPWRRAGVAAAVVACIAALAAGGVYRATRRPVDAVAPRTDETFVTANRERAELRLSDGTRVHLAPASRLRVAASFGDTRRDVYLEGEGYFEVVHDTQRPFSVFARNAVARDLGTAFSVRSYSDDAAVRVVVRSGVVALSQVGKLGAGDVGRIGVNGATSLTRGVRVDSLLGWLEGRLVFRDAPLSAVLLELRRWHDVDVQLADSALRTLPFTGVLTDASFRTSIGVVAATLGLRVRRDGDRVTLARIGGLTPPPRAPAATRAAR
jgi:transmembrane sensor